MFIDKEAIINIINKSGNNASFIYLAKELKIKPFENKNLSKHLNDLKKHGIIAFSKKTNSYFIPKHICNINTTFKLSSSDYGFVNFKINENDNIERRAIIFKENINSALNSDVVNVDIFQEKDDDNLFFGIIKKIISHGNEYIFGLINDNKDFEPIGFTNKYTFIYDKKNVIENTYVKFKIQSVNNNEIILDFNKTISNKNKPYADIDLIVETLNIDKTFNENVVNEAKNIPDEVEDKHADNRIDLTKELIVTIDGQKTKDFDDAISVKKKDKNFILSIHIADVAHYVKEGSEIDKQALSRATSIYLIDKVIPMLPEKLSNGICSLNPNVDRYTISVEIEIDNKGKIINKKLFPSTINSKYRLTYDQVDNFKNEEVFKNDHMLREMIENAYELSKILSKNKANDGYIDFEINESVIELDANGVAINIKQKQRLSSEVLIENFMVLANETVSEIVTKHGFPCIYRIHEAPSEEKFLSLEEIIKTIKLNDVHVKHSDDPKDFSKLVQKIKQQRFDDFVKVSLLRTMQKAKYSIDNIGHFGLASTYYSHFTSPIRRYPDLALHRIIWELIFKKNKSYLNNLSEKLNNVALISSQKEEEAVAAERKVSDIKKAEFYKNNINKMLEGTIVSILKFGIFVEFEDGVDALVHTSRLSNEICKINENSTIMNCNNINYVLGQKVKVKIIAINKLEGRIDAQIIN